MGPFKMNVTKYFWLVLVVFLAGGLPAQEMVFKIKEGCNFYSSPSVLSVNYKKPDSRIVRIWDNILDVTGEPDERIELLESSDVSNAMAAIDYSGARAIFYNPAFIQSLESESVTRWSSIFLLAHEMGHHFKNHTLNHDSNNDHSEELEADGFATRVLVRMGADANETGAAIASFINDKDEGYRSHPAPSARVAKVSEVWEEESRKMIKEKNPRVSLKRSIQLNKKAFRNPWSIIDEAKATIDDEKVEIRFNVPMAQARKYQVCIKSNEESIIPGKNPGTLKGLDRSTQPWNPGEGQMTIWNYSLDFYSRNEIEVPNDIRVYVFDRDDLPELPKTGSAVIGTLLSSAGVGLGIWGLSRIAEGQNIYDNEYRITFDQETYEQADGKYFSGQIIAYVGVGLMGVGGTILKRRNKLAKEYHRCNCQNEKDSYSSVAPSISSNGLGIVYSF